MAPVSEAMDRFRAGEPDAIRALYREYGGAVHTVAISIVRDRELAADVVQQTFVKAWRAAASFERGREIAPWLYSIARHTAIDTLRSEARPTRGGHQPEVEVQVESQSMEADLGAVRGPSGDRCPAPGRARGGTTLAPAGPHPRRDRRAAGRAGRYRQVALGQGPQTAGDVAGPPADRRNLARTNQRSPTVLIDEEPR